jgi:hypothetical protein
MVKTSGNRKNRGGHHNKDNNTNHHYRHSDSLSHTKQDSASTAQYYLDFNKVLQEADEGFQITWREIVLALMGVAMLAVLSIFVGIAAGMTISIHYYDDQSPVVVRRMDARETTTMYSGSAAFRKVTTLDPTIASSNVMQSKERDGLDLGKVITTSASGQLNVLMVVEEATPLHVDGRVSSKSKASSSSSSSSSSNTDRKKGFETDEGSKRIPMTMEQANLLRPGYSKWMENQPDIVIREPTILPKQCSDGYTIGFDDWRTLKAAVQEANSISAERFMKWSAYFANVGRSFAAFEDDDWYYEEDVVFTICPGATLRSRRGPIYINAENVIIQCLGCAIDVGGTHLNFGPHAKNVLVRGVTFKNAQSSSMTLFHDGAEASFEDCFWVGNSGIDGKFGGVADVNSTSTVNFYRCEISQGSKISALGNVHPGATSSLSIRT